ncbi:MAG: TIGR03503 family protein [Enterovibrio sp.]
MANAKRVKEFLSFLLIAILFLLFEQAKGYAQEQEIPLLDNRFRIDHSVSQIAFIIHRKKNSQPAVLIQPDGTKIFADSPASNVSWYKDATIDIVTVRDPMPGPWQAIGSISQENSIRILSDLSMRVDAFPKQLYQGEMIKFSARLLQDQKPLVLRDFLDNVALEVNFSEHVSAKKKRADGELPLAWTLGKFVDDGSELDEVGGDGVFTVGLKVDIAPGKYLAHISSANGVFFRSFQQEVLVYPTPYAIKFEQAQEKGKLHKLIIESRLDDAKQVPLLAHIEMTAPDGIKTIYEGATLPGQRKLVFEIDDQAKPGQHSWQGKLFTEQINSNRPLMFELAKSNFTVVDFAAQERALQLRNEREAQRAKMEQYEQEQKLHEENQKKALTTLIAGNVGMLLLVGLCFAIYYQLKKRRKP